MSLEPNGCSSRRHFKVLSIAQEKGTLPLPIMNVNINANILISESEISVSSKPSFLIRESPCFLMHCAPAKPHFKMYELVIAGTAPLLTLSQKHTAQQTFIHSAPLL